MNWICSSLLFANLTYVAFNLWGQEVNRVSATKNIGDRASKHASSRASGFDGKGPRILLSPEISQSINKSFEAGVLKQPALVAAADGLRPCVGLGPFENVISARKVAVRLQATGYLVEMTSVDTHTGESDYRVLMPPLSSQQDAFRRHRELKSRGINSFLITKGLDALGLSLGVFSSYGSAESYRLALAGLGYDVLLDVLPRVNRGYWVQISEGMFPEELLLEVAAQFIDVEEAETGCMN